MGKSPSDVRVVEGSSGTWFYHLSRDPKGLRSLCGKATMPCQLPRSAWGTVTHLRERYCRDCVAHETSGTAVDGKGSS